MFFVPGSPPNSHREKSGIALPPISPIICVNVGNSAYDQNAPFNCCCGSSGFREFPLRSEILFTR